jgi:SAM-dependent MidA family methyltransferase
MQSEAVQFPAPSAAARAQSAALAAHLRAEIERAGGWIRFDRYMQRVLYEPELGYYSGGSTKIGAAGDFTTAPELGPLLPHSIAALCDDLFAVLSEPTILELGAGTGSMAQHLLRALDARGRRDVRYLILEPSADLRVRQQRTLAALGERITWIDALPSTPIDGLILANEVADALPVVRFLKSNNAVRPIGVSVSGGGFRWQTGREDSALSGAVHTLEQRLAAPLPADYRSEICLLLPAWLRALAAALGRGAVLLTDYGLPRREYYHPQRSDGTLICHYRHRAHDDPFLFPGLQDISAWVDFSACADAAAEAGLGVSGFTTQGQFLLSTAAAPGAVDLGAYSPAELGAIKTLLLPGEMGERFKLLLLTRGAEGCGLPGRDFRDWL